MDDDNKNNTNTITNHDGIGDDTCDASIDPTNGRRMLMNLKTVQSFSMKTVFECIKEIIIDCNMEFDKHGMSLLVMDSSCSALVFVKLEGPKFDTYYCPNPILCGINLQNFYKILRTISNSSDMLSMTVYEDEPNELVISVDNVDKRSKTSTSLKLLDIDIEEFDVPNVVCDIVATISSADFVKLLRDCSSMSDSLHIRIPNDREIEFSCEGDFAHHKVIMEAVEKSSVNVNVDTGDDDIPGVDSEEDAVVDTDTEDDNDIEPSKDTAGIQISYFDKKSCPLSSAIEGNFSLKYLLLFCKNSHSLSPVLELMMKTDYPLIVKYTCTSLGFAQFALSGRMNEAEL